MLNFDQLSNLKIGDVIYEEDRHEGEIKGIVKTLPEITESTIDGIKISQVSFYAEVENRIVQVLVTKGWSWGTPRLYRKSS